MRLRTSDGQTLWLGYSMNVHPGGTLATTLEALEHTVLPLRRRLAVDGPFGVGLRLDGATVHQLARDAAARRALAGALSRHGLVAFTGNAFVVGAFHGRPLKDAVYAPSWRDPARAAYTVAFATLLAELASTSPGLREVSLSTSPLAWRAWGEEAEEVERGAHHLAETARALVELEARTGVRVRLGLEPEPGCTIDTMTGAAAFCAGPLARALASRGPEARVGICYDVCHQAVMHEDVAAGLDALAGAGVEIAKAQLSSALDVADPTDPAQRSALEAFVEPVYLHQVGAPGPDGLTRLAPDLVEAFGPGSAVAGCAPWRVHFHVPVYRAGAAGGLGTTRPQLDALLAAAARGRASDHLEIETYTFGVLPPAERGAGAGSDLVASLAREYAYVLDVLHRHGVVPVDAPVPEPTP